MLYEPISMRVVGHVFLVGKFNGKKMNHWVALAIAIVAEVIGTTALKTSNEFTRLGHHSFWWRVMARRFILWH